MILANYRFNYYFRGNLVRPIILLLHGFMGSSHDFDLIISSLSDRFCFLCVDLPGHGQTKVLGSEKYYTMPNTALALIKLLDKNKIDRVVLLGYSMGGRLALYLTINFPNYFSKVILESASPGLNTIQERELRIAKDRQLATELETENFALFLKKWYDNSLFSSFREHPDFNRTIERRLNNNPLELARSLRNMSTGMQPSLWDKLDRVQIPLLLIVGELDRKFVAINRTINNLCPNCELKIIERTGHNLHLENACEYARIIETYFN
jgi:2-succinyl-6-hydroxy-2,4-cyclohexadiene-1-carboxylate synthase